MQVGQMRCGAESTCDWSRVSKAQLQSISVILIFSARIASLVQLEVLDCTYQRKKAGLNTKMCLHSFTVLDPAHIVPLRQRNASKRVNNNAFESTLVTY